MAAGLVTLPAAGSPARANGAPPVFTGTALEDSVRTLRGPRFEDAFNDLLAASLEASAAAAPEARALARLCDRVATTETRVLGSRIAARTLATRAHWDAAASARRAQAWRWERAGWSARGQREYATAESLLALALPEYHDLGDLRREAWAAGRWAACAFDRQELELAATRYERALTLRRALGDSLLLGNTLSDLGGLELRRHHEPRALPWLREAVAIRTALGDARLAATLGLLASAYAVTGPADSAAVRFEQALALPLADDRRRDLLLNHASFLAAAGRSSEAGQQARTVRALADAAGDSTQADQAIGLLADLAFARGRYSDALELEDELAARALSRADSAALLTARLRQSRVYAAALDPGRAETLLAPVIEIAAASGDTALWVRALINRATARTDRGQSAAGTGDASTALRLAVLAGDSSSVHDAASALGNLAHRERDYAAAGRWFRRALAAVPRQADSRTLNARLNAASADIHAGALASAERELRDIASQADSLGALETASSARSDLADIAWRRGDRAGAIAASRDNLERVERLRAAQRRGDPSIDLFADHVEEFESIVHFLVRTGLDTHTREPLVEAFGWAERSRARALLDRRTAAGGPAAAPLGLRAVQARLAPGEALLEYLLADSLSVLWVVRPDTFVAVELPPRPALQFAVRRVRGPLERDDAGGHTLDADLDRLSTQLLAGAGPMLADAGHWIVVPDGALAFLPFEALRERGRYVIERHAVSYAPSASLHALSPAPAAPLAAGAPWLVALGAPDFGARPAADLRGGAGAALAPLPGTEQEVRRVAALVPAPETALLFGRDASRAGLLGVRGIAQARVLHLATHGEASSTDPAHSTLWFAPDSAGGAPSRLNASEIPQLGWSADLVALAACESGLGELTRGEGVQGFSRAFLAGGARSVTASLWRVSDRSSAELMERFYRELLTHGATRAEALRRAKLALLRSPATRAPFHWAAFVLIGDDGRLTLAR